jgi:uncharacterized membrane protein (Fun14 family)
MGFALKEILKWMLIIVGFLAGMFFVGVQLLQKYGTTLWPLALRLAIRFKRKLGMHLVLVLVVATPVSEH